jgi:DNA-binding transcriptional MerR regulator/predicted transcriptional regulator YdeE
VIKIGDFSALSHVSVKALRYYDDIGLLKPVHVDSSSGYRYYSAKQLPRLHRILVLKDLGLSLDQIAPILEKCVTADQLRGMFLLRRAEQQERVQAEQSRLLRIDAHLTLIEKESDMARYDVLVKDIPAQWIASVREVIPTYPDVGRLYPRVIEKLGPNPPISLSTAIWHDTEFKESDVDAEAGFYLKGPIEPRDGIQVHELPAAKVASLIHHGAFKTLNQAYGAVMQWIESNGYRISGPVREVYLHVNLPVKQDDESSITEIQVPVAKA